MEDNKDLNKDNKDLDKDKDLNKDLDENQDNKDKDLDKEKEKTFTQEELEKIISKRLERERKKADEEKAEAEKLAKMSAEERAKAEFEKEKQKFEEERNQYKMERLELQVVKELSSKNLPTEFSKYLLDRDAETCMENIKTFEIQWQQAIEKAVDEKLKGNTPRAGSNTNITITKEDFLKMDFFEQNKFATENPELYKELMQ